MTTLTNLVNHTDKYDGVLKELAALLVPHMIAHPDVQAMLSASSQLVTRESVEEIVKEKIDALGPVSMHKVTREAIEEMIQAKIDALGPIDKDMVREVCEEVIDASDMDDKINDWMTCNFDISDYQSEIVDMIELDDAIENHLNTYLHGEVLSCVQGLKFDVEVSSR